MKPSAVMIDAPTSRSSAGVALRLIHDGVSDDTAAELTPGNDLEVGVGVESRNVARSSEGVTLTHLPGLRCNCSLLLTNKQYKIFKQSMKQQRKTTNVQKVTGFAHVVCEGVCGLARVASCVFFCSNLHAEHKISPITAVCYLSKVGK